MLLIVVLVLSAAPVFAQEKKDNWMRAGYVALAATSLADAETTGRALERPGMRERNPILKPFAGTPGAAGLVSGALSGGIGLGAYALHRKGKRAEAKLVIWAWTLVRAAVVVHNVRQLRK